MTIHRPSKLYFKAKRYGWGWTPATWEGWLITFLFLVFLIGNAFRIEAAHYSTSNSVLAVLLQNGIAVLILIAICLYTGEKPRWRWGNKDEVGSGSNNELS